MNRTLGCAARAAVLAFFSAAGVCGAQPVGTAFTYQGALRDDGASATGSYDFRFVLFNATVGGSQVGMTLCADNVDVQNGRFSATIDFGAAYSGNASWLELSVRRDSTAGNCSSAAGYTIISPRQQLTPTPNAVYASTAGSSAQWRSVGGAVTNSNNGFVGINRSSAVDSSEAFGILADTGSSSLGGMYVKSTSSAGKPYYGLTNGTQRAYAYLDGTSGALHIVNNALPALTIDGEGEVGINDFSPFSTVSIRHLDRHNICLDVESDTDTRLGVFRNNSGSPSSTPVVWMSRIFAGPHLWLTTGSGTIDGSVSLLVSDGTDAGPTSGGFICCGDMGSTNVAIDNNEILARNNGTASTLFLNANGGHVSVGDATDHGFGLNVATTAGKPGGGSWSSFCDPRLKTDMKQMAGTLDRLLGLRGYEFRYTSAAVADGRGLSGEQIGLNADEVAGVFPGWVGEDAGGYKHVTERGVVALMVESLRDLREEKDRQLEKLRDKNRELRERLQRLEERLIK